MDKINLILIRLFSNEFLFCEINGSGIFVRGNILIVVLIFLKIWKIIIMIKLVDIKV